MMFVQISKGHRHKKEDKEVPKTEEEESYVSEELCAAPEPSEEFSAVELSSSNEGETTKPSRGDLFINRLKKSSVGKLFKSDSKDSEISIYTLDQGMRRTNHEESVHNIDSRNKIRSNLYNDTDTSVQCHRRSVSSQASPYPPYRLFFLPSNDWKENDSKLQIITKLLFCQCSLACFLIFWVISTALLFYLTEGPFEQELVCILFFFLAS